MRTRVWSAVLLGVLPGICGGAVLGSGPAVAAPLPEADLAFHGSAVMDGDQVEVRLTPRNNGPAAVADATVRLRWSAVLADRQQLPAGCVREDDRTVLCGTGALAADGAGEQVRVAVRLRERPSEVMLEVDTAWNGGVLDKDRSNDRLTVLVLATGDAYAF
ncbi:hypothetical protein LK08_08325 [Streptomyces sp. MUSC 125]|uniref:hypothetical protein n=1 Tax=unclassified Streptomyces TaxID=2593676 RepID=UPI00057C9707|nr:MULTISPECIES: hypothetical protein [unclassified Streptomyces]KIE27378.1 hypothetical protein LK08_08325 [Streptomyces sp. MUSC 125]MCH0556525.1 hypothetical protein [Streptomyces sp. MUM 16J]